MARLFLAACLLLAPLSAPVLADELGARLEALEQRYREEGPEPVLAEFESLRAEAINSGKPAIAATALRFIGECHWLMGQFEEAEQTLVTALSEAEDLNDPTLQTKALNVLGLLAWDQGNYDVAMDRFQSAAMLAEELGDPKMQGAILNNRSLVLDELGDYRASLAQYQQVLQLYAQVDFPRGEGDTRGNIGGVHLLLGRFNEAIEHYASALAISEGLESVQAMSQDHGNLGYAYAGLGQAGTAIEHFDRALALARQAGLAQEEAYWLRGKASAEIAAGRYDRGLQDHREAIRIFEETGADGPLLDALHDMGALLLELGDPASAEGYFDRALAGAVKFNRPRSIALNEIALGKLQQRRRLFDSARSRFESALQRSRDAGDVGLEMRALLSLATCDLDQGRHEAALAQARQALAVATREQMTLHEVEAWLVIGNAQQELDRPEEALSSYGRVLEQVGAGGDVDLAWQAHYGRATALERLDRKSDAIAALEESAALIENVRSRLREKRFRSGYLQDKHEVYTRLVRLQMELGRGEDAFRTAERLRSFGYREFVPPVNADEVPGLSEMRARIRQLQRAIDQEHDAPIPEQRQRALETFSAELIAAEQAFQALLDDQASRRPTSSRHADVNATRARLADDEAMLEYVVGPEHVMVFVLTRDEFQTQIIPVEHARLASRIELLRDLLMEHGSERWIPPARALAETLVHPLMEAGWLNGIERLVLVPHGTLNYLPFAVLPTLGDTPPETMVERFDIAYLPSASIMSSTAGLAPSTSVLTVSPARSRLQYAPEEARTIASLFEPRSHSLQGKNATEAAFRALAGDFEVLHLATHGYFNPLNPMLSGLELEADEDHDGLLEVHEILGLELQASLVTLSACQTGLGSGYFSDVPAGDDFVSLTRAFLQAGSSNVLATLWEVDDRSIVGLMTDFYTRLEEAGVGGDTAVALAHAQRALLASDQYRHPYYWAPFVLVGASSSASPANS